jgi:hypothetical protein
MLWYNNPDAVQAAHDQIVRENRQVAHQRRLLRIVGAEASETVAVV